ncbi:alpha/beta fold hydrolase [Streptomyces sp. JNUCC 64]
MTDGDGTARIDGVRLAYRVSGPPDAPAVVLLHALGERGADWDEVAPVLARDRRVYVPDLRGHGRSDRPGAYAAERLRDDVLGLLDVWGRDRVDLVGHSLGGVVAHLVASHRPERVRRLVLEDVPVPRPRDPVPPVRPDGEPDFDWDAVLAVRRWLDRPDPRWLAGLARITAPTLAVAGGPGSHLPQEGVAELVRRVPDGRLVTIPVGHLVHRAAPTEFTAAVTAFLDAPPPSPQARPRTR